MAESRLRIALVGAGFMGRMHASVYRSLDQASLAVIVDKTSTRAEALANDNAVRWTTRYEDVLEDPNIDAVDICLPTYLHKEFAVKAAKAGKHVFCEKPMAMSLEEADAMISACEEAGVRLMIGHCIRFWPEYALLKRLADEGELGALKSVNMTRYGGFPTWSSDNWLAEEAKAGGGVLDMHIHDTDFAFYIFGEPSKTFTAGTIDSTGPSQAFTTYTYPNGAVAHLEGGWNLPPGTPFKMAFRAIFERGAAIMDGGPMTVYPRDGEAYTPEFPTMSAAGGGNIADLGGYYHELKEFVECITSGREFTISTPQTSRRSLEATLEEIEAIKSMITSDSPVAVG